MGKMIRIATRGSILALTQTKQIAAQLERCNPGVECDLITFKTTGDRVTDRPLSSFRGTGVFVKELQNALLAGEADIAVHSLKDVPVVEQEQLSFCAFPERAMANDILLTKDDTILSELPAGSVIGTSSLRRMVQLKAVRPDLQFADLRGNLDTRIRKLEEGLYGAIVLAAAGMIRIARHFPESSILPLDTCLPAAGQGILALECRIDDAETAEYALPVDDAKTRSIAECERMYLRVIGGGCTLPIGVHAQIDAQKFEMNALIGDVESMRLIRDSIRGKPADGPELSRELALRMLEQCKSEGISINVD